MLYRWDFGDGSGKVIQSKDAPCQSMGQPIEKEKKQMYVQDSVNFTYLIPGNQMHTRTHKCLSAQSPYRLFRKYHLSFSCTLTLKQISDK